MVATHKAVNSLMYLLLLCLAFAAGSCRGRSASSESPPPTPPQDRRAVQRANLRAEAWQLVICGGDEGLGAWADSLAAAPPRGKSVVVVSCNAVTLGVPAVIVGDRLPDGWEAVVGPVLEAIRYTPDAALQLSGYLDGRTASDSMPTTFTLYQDPDAEQLLSYLRTTAEGGWWSIFGGQWAYRLRAADGTVRLGDYADGSWEFATGSEIVLPPAQRAATTPAGRAVYRLDGTPLPPRLDSVLLIALAADTGGVDSISSVYLYPSVERIGLRRGNMAAVQREGRSLHLVPTALRSGDERPEFASPAFYAGMTFAHEGYRVYNGYGGREVVPALDSLKSLSINAVAIVPYTYMPAADRVGELPVPTGAGAENDGAVVYAIRQAQQRGWAVLLKPQIWVGGGWPGAVDFAEASGWDQFFTAYERWITHYARMAEAEGVPALCIGTELVQASLHYPDRWQAIIRNLRKLYGGKLTYAANWGEEFEQLTFWTELDAVGLNSYYPLAGDTSVSDAALLAGAQRWMDRADSIARAADRPLWLTEVGYRSVEGAWINPHAEAGDRGASTEAQRRCYQAMLAAAGKSTELQGMFVWKWPSYLGYRDRWSTADRGFTPGGKPAADLLRQFYQQRTTSR